MTSFRNDFERNDFEVGTVNVVFNFYLLGSWEKSMNFFYANNFFSGKLILQKPRSCPSFTVYEGYIK